MITSHGGGRMWKIKWREWKYGAVAGILNRGSSWHFSYLIFSWFINFTFRNYFSLCKIVLCIWRKIIFSATIKCHSKVFKNEPEKMPWIKITWNPLTNYVYIQSQNILSYEMILLFNCLCGFLRVLSPYSVLVMIAIWICFEI